MHFEVKFSYPNVIKFVKLKKISHTKLSMIQCSVISEKAEALIYPYLRTLAE